MAEHTKASTAGSAHARYVAYREQGFGRPEALQLAGGWQRHRPDCGVTVTHCAPQGCRPSFPKANS